MADPQVQFFADSKETFFWLEKKPESLFVLGQHRSRSLKIAIYSFTINKDSLILKYFFQSLIYLIFILLYHNLFWLLFHSYILLSTFLDCVLGVCLISLREHLFCAIPNELFLCIGQV